MKGRDAKPEGAKVSKFDQVSRLQLLPDYIYEVLKKGSEKARAVAAQTLSEVRNAMGIEYFKGMNF